MATNMHKRYTSKLVREWKVPAGTKGGDLVIHALSGQVGVALADRGDGTRPANIPGVTGGTVPNGGAGFGPEGATVAVDGSWRFPVTGVTAGYTLPTYAPDGSTVPAAGTPEGTKVYAVVTGGKVTELTLTEGSNTFVGTVDDCNIVGTTAAIKIGAVL